MPRSVVGVDTADGVTVITIQRPHVKNALNAQTAHEIGAAIDRVEQSDDVRVAIITGQGDTFCSGMDLRAFGSGEVPSTRSRGFAGIARRPPSKPIIAAVEGYAVAGGFELVLACDLVVAASNAQFGLPEVKRGLVAAGGGLLRLPRRVPRNVAMELILTGGLLPADRAHQLGLVNRVVPPGTALDQARALADAIRANAPVAVRVSKQVVTESADWPQDEAFARQSEIVAPILTSEDAREGARAFREKRPAIWRAR